MTITKTGAAVGEFIPAALAKAHGAIEHSDDDSLLAVYTSAAQDWIERTCDVHLTRAEFTYSGQTFDLDFSGYPNPGIQSVEYADLDGATQSVAEFSISDGTLTVEDSPSAQSVTVVFDAGYTDADRPAHFVQAGLLLVAAFYAERENVADSQIQPLPFGVKSLLAASRTFAR